MTTRTVAGVTQTLVWDVLSNLTSVTPASGAATTYLYDASGQRYAAITGSTATVYMGSWEATDPSTDTTSNTDVKVTRYYGADGAQLGSKTTGGSLLVTLGDVQGSAQVSVDSAGVTTSNSYTPYGTKRATATPIVSAHGWLNQIADTTGLTYLNARYYDPVLGRFLSPDPVLNPADPRTLDPYRYADNNPIMAIDATGLWPDWDAVGGFASGFGDGLWSTAVMYHQMSPFAMVFENDTWQSRTSDYSKQLAASVEDNGVYATAVMQLDPAYALMDSTSAAIDSAHDGDWHGSGSSTATATIAAASLIAIALPAGKGVPRLSAGESVPMSPMRTVTIGRDMQGRVIPFALENGYDFYAGTPGWIPRKVIAKVFGKGTRDSVDMAFNRHWIDRQKRLGNRIVDIGAPVGAKPSRYYDMETNRTAGYWNYVEEHQK